MKRVNLTVCSIAVVVLIGCVSVSPSPTTPAPTPLAAGETPAAPPRPTHPSTAAPARTTTVPPTAMAAIVTATATAAPALLEIRAGIYAADHAFDLSLPASGYDLYVIGEVPHAAREVRLLAIEYLKILHGAIGLRDLVLEVPQAYERSVGAFVLGRSDTLPGRAYYWGDLLLDVRALNESLPEEEKIRLHLTDVDFSLQEIHTHLQAIQDELGAVGQAVELPPLKEFESWGQEEVVALADQLSPAVENHEALRNELTTVKRSIRFFFAGRAEEGGGSAGQMTVKIREGTIEQNMTYLLGELGGAPVLALYGGWHTQRRQAQSFAAAERPWVQRLVESGTAVYSLLVVAMQGRVGKSDGSTSAVYTGHGQILFSDGTTLGPVLRAAFGYNMVFIDLAVGDHAAAQLGELGATEVPAAGGYYGSDYQGAPAGEVCDGIILLQKVTPVPGITP